MIKCFFFSLFHFSLNLNNANLLYLFISVIKYLCFFNHFIFRYKPYIQNSETYLTSVFTFEQRSLRFRHGGRHCRFSVVHLRADVSSLILSFFSCEDVENFMDVYYSIFICEYLYQCKPWIFSTCSVLVLVILYAHILYLPVDNIWEIFMVIDYSPSDPESALELLHLM